MSKFLVVIFLRLVWRGPIFPNAALVKSNLDYVDFTAAESYWGKPPSSKFDRSCVDAS
jgi:hypothetical protein